MLLAFAIATAILARSAQAAPSSRLVYTRAADAETCPDETALRKAVSARVGYDPFLPWANLTVIVLVRKEGNALTGHVEIVGKDGIARGARDLRQPGDDCAELVTSLALAISIALDTIDVAETPKEPPAPPASKPSEEDAPAPPPPADLTPDAEAPPPPRPAAFASRGPAFDLALGPSVTVGVAPAIALGGEVSARLAWPRFSLSLGGRFDLPASRPADGGGDVGSSLRAGSLAGCLALPARFGGCAVLSLGELATSGPAGLSASSESAFYTGAGGRLELEEPLAKGLGLRSYGEALATLVPTTLQVRGVDEWHTSPVVVTLGAAAVVHF